MKKNELRGLGDALGVATGVGLEVVCWIALGTVVGHMADVFGNISPIGTVLGILGGFGLAMRSIYRRITRIES